MYMLNEQYYEQLCSEIWLPWQHGQSTANLSAFSTNHGHKQHTRCKNHGHVCNRSRVTANITWQYNWLLSQRQQL